MDALHGCELNEWRKGLMATTQECCKQYWTSHGGSTPQSSSCMAIYHSSRKQSELDEQDCWRSRDELIRDLLLWTPSHGWAKAGRRARTYLQQLYADTRCNPKTCQKQWTIGRSGWRGLRISMLMAWHDDDDK